MLGTVGIVVAEEPAKDKVTLKQFTNSIGMRIVPIKAGFCGRRSVCAGRPGCSDAQTVAGTLRQSALASPRHPSSP
jgi:hypothetical protein